MGIVSGTMLLVDGAIKPVHRNIVLATINGDVDVWRLYTIARYGLESLADTGTFLLFGNEFMYDEVMIEGVVTFIIYDERNDVFDDSPYM
ncbi:hypothetical protein HX889_09205 [Pseudomonas reactans]|nr:hypothetical protein [Pseudomonas reactans]